MNTFFKNFDWSFVSIAKVLGGTLLAVFVLTAVVSLVGVGINTVVEPQRTMMSSGMDYAQNELSYSSKRMAVPPTADGYEEGYIELKTISLTYKSFDHTSICDEISALFSREDVTVLSNSSNRHTCNLRFSVEKASETEVLNLLLALKPLDVNNSIENIVKSISGYDQELEMLQSRLEQIEKVIEEGLKDFDTFQKIALEDRDVESMAKILDSKFTLITQRQEERTNILNNIKRLETQKEQMLERSSRTEFVVSVERRVIVDMEEIKSSWIRQMNNFFDTMSSIAQDITINFVIYIARTVQGVIYLIAALYVVKFAWKFLKYLWNK